MKTIKYSREAFFSFLLVCYGLMVTAAMLIKLLSLQPGTTAYYACYFLGLLSPTAGAVAYVYKETKSLFYFKSMLKPIRISKGWTMILLLPLSLIFSYLSMSISGLPLKMEELAGLNTLLFGFLGWASMIWLEELGWRGLLLPVLQEKFTPLFSTILLNLIWVLWHLPLLYLIGMSIEQVLLFSLQTFGIATVLTWTYNHTHSVLVATLLHASYNATSGWLLTAVPSLDPNDVIGVQAFGPLMLGLLLIIITKGNLGWKVRSEGATLPNTANPILKI